MRDSHIVAIGALVLIITGIVLIGVSMTIHIPSAYKTFLGIPYAVDPAFATSFYEIIVLSGMGVFFIGFGSGMLGCTAYIYRLEKKISQTPPPP